MNTFWLKVAGAAVVAVLVLVVVGTFWPGGSEPPRPAEPEKTVYDQWAEDDKRLNAEPQYTQPPVPQGATDQGPQGPGAQSKPAQQPGSSLTAGTQPPSGPQGDSTQPPMPQFKKLSPEEELEAQKLWQWVVTQRKMGRLPVMGYGQMVKACRQIIQRWPESKYAFLAKRALADIPPRYRKMYNITPEEIDLGNLK